MNEIWKDVTGYEGLYQVSNLGRVKAMPKRGHKEKIMKPSLKKDGYNRILLSKKGKYKTLYVHRLVAEAFLSHTESKCEVNHINGIKTDNYVYNLEWVTKSQNQLHAIEMGLRAPSPMIGRKGKLHPTSRPVLQFDLEGNFINEWKCISEAARAIGCSPSSISSCASTHIRNKTCKGYIWKYK